MEQTGAFDLEYHLRRKNIVMDFLYTIIICTAIAFVIAFSNPTSHLSVSFYHVAVVRTCHLHSD